MTEDQGQPRSPNRIIVKLDPDRFSAETDLQTEAMALAENVDSALYVADELARVTARPSGRSERSSVRPG